MIMLLRRNPKFLGFWLSNTSSQLSDWLRNMALIFLVLELSHHSAKAVSFNMFMEFAPILAAPLIGVYVDRWSRKMAFQLGTVLRAAITMAVALTLEIGSMTIIFIGGFLASFCSVLISSSTSGFLQEIVQQDDQKAAVSLNQFNSSLIMLLGPALGTVIYTAYGATVTLVLSGVLLLVSAFLTAFIRMPKRPQEAGGSASLMAELKSGMAFAWSDGILKPLLVSMALIGLGAGILNALEVFIVTEFLGLPEGMLATILTIQAIGMLVSVPLVNRLRIPVERLFPGAMVIMGIGIAFMVSYPSLLVTVAGYLIFSFGNIGVNVAQGTILQSHVPAEYQGRVSSLIYMVLMSSMGLAMLLAGVIHEALTTQMILVGTGVVAILSGCWMRYLQSKNILEPGLEK